MPDVLQTVGNKNWLLIVATKILDIGWMLLKTSTGGNLMWTTPSTSAGFECKLNFVYLFTFHFFFTPVPNGARHFLAYRLDSTRLMPRHMGKRLPGQFANYLRVALLMEKIMSLVKQAQTFINRHVGSRPWTHIKSTRRWLIQVRLNISVQPLANINDGTSGGE